MDLSIDLLEYSHFMTAGFLQKSKSMHNVCSGLESHTVTSIVFYRIHRLVRVSVFGGHMRA